MARPHIVNENNTRMSTTFSFNRGKQRGSSSARHTILPLPSSCQMRRWSRPSWLNSMFLGVHFSSFPSFSTVITRRWEEDEEEGSMMKAP